MAFWAKLLARFAAQHRPWREKCLILRCHKKDELRTFLRMFRTLLKNTNSPASVGLTIDILRQSACNERLQNCSGGVIALAVFGPRLAALGSPQQRSTYMHRFPCWIRPPGPESEPASQAGTLGGIRDTVQRWAPNVLVEGATRSSREWGWTRAPLTNPSPSNLHLFLTQAAIYLRGRD